MKCVINPKYYCYEQMKRGKAFWSYYPKICENCDIFKRSKQKVLK